MRELIPLILLSLLLPACGAAAPAVARAAAPTVPPTWTSLALRPEDAPLAVGTTVPPPPPPPTSTPLPLPTLRALPTPVGDWYEARAGETLRQIAARYEVPVATLVTLNRVEADERLLAGHRVSVPSSITAMLPSLYLAHDSEVVFGRSYVGWHTQAYLDAMGGYLASYREGGRTGAEIIDEIAMRYHVGPRALLALIELNSGWVTRSRPGSATPLGPRVTAGRTLRAQTTWAARELVAGYYTQLEGRQDWVMLSNGVAARLYPGTNAGSAAVARVLAGTLDAERFIETIRGAVFEERFHDLFGDVAGGAVAPPDGRQPHFILPWREGERWYLTGGPHGGYGDNESGWAALDFAPPVPAGCGTSSYPVLAIAPGLVVGSERGETWIDMDGDGDIRTGWVIFYMHLSSNGRVEKGETVHAGDRVGYPSCEGGRATGAHVHIARLYDGQWMPADAPIPFQIGPWQAQAVINNSYNGRLIHNDGRTVDSCDCRNNRKNRIPSR